MGGISRREHPDGDGVKLGVTLLLSTCDSVLPMGMLMTFGYCGSFTTPKSSMPNSGSPITCERNGGAMIVTISPLARHGHEIETG
jgi:hypothetical protein